MTLDRQKLAKIIEKTNKKYGAGALFRGGGKNDNTKVQFISTGIPDLDLAMGGGLPLRRITEIYGPESAGKTSLVYQLCGRFPQSCFVDCEGTYDDERRRVFDPESTVLVRQPQYGEATWEIIIEMADAGMPFIALDSVPYMVSKREFEQDDMEKNARVGGSVAQLASRKMPILAATCRRSGSTVVFLNQVRDRIGGVPWGDPYTTPGGRMLRHAYSVRLQVGRKGWITAKEVRIGMVTAVRVVKSKVGPPQRTAELPMLFSEGYVSHEAARAATLVAKKARRLAKKAEDGD